MLSICQLDKEANDSAQVVISGASAHLAKGTDSFSEVVLPTQQTVTSVTA
jgi:hypothetical protein